MRAFLVVSVLSIAIPGIASAQQGAAGAGAPAPVDDLRALFQTAVADYEQGRFAAALRAFERLQRANPSADLWFNIARCHEELGASQLAADHLRRYLRDRVDAPDRAEVETRIDRLEREVQQQAALDPKGAMGLLQIRADMDGARVSVDGRHLGSTPFANAIPLPAGEHRLDLSRAGDIPVRATVTLSSRTLTRADVRLLPRTRYETVPRTKPWTWATASVALVALVAGGSFAIAGAGSACEATACDRIGEYGIVAGLTAALAALATSSIESGYDTRLQGGTGVSRP